MPEKVVKSVGRVFEILEMFERERRPLSAIEVSRELGYPHTSTLAILKSMQALGYLSHDREGWTFIPTQALPQLTEWVSQSLHGETAIMNVLNSLHQATGETINLSSRTGEFIKIIYGVESVHAVAINVRQGVVMPVNASHTGMVSLACLNDEEIARIIRKMNAAKYPDARKLSVKQALDEVKEIRAARFSAGYDMLIRGIGAVCFPVMPRIGTSPIIVGVVGPSDRIRQFEEKIISAAKRAMAENDVALAYPKEPAPVAARP